MGRASPTALVPLLLVGLAACSLSRVRQEDCSEDAACRDLFGIGHYCADDGFCAEIDPLERCGFFPASAEFPLDPAEDLLFATLFNESNQTHLARVRSAELAVTQANENGGLAGRRFVLLECTIEEEAELDELSQEEAAVATARQLVRQVGVPAIVGPASSSDTEAVFNAIGADRSTVVISPSATSPSLTDLDGIAASDEAPGMLWRTAPPDSLQGQVIAADMTSRGVGSVAVVYANGAYGDALTQLFAERFDGDVELFPFGNDSARDQAVVDAGDAGVDEVLFISSEVGDITAFLNGAALISSYDSLGIFLTDAAATVQVLTDAASASDLFDQVRGTQPSIPSGNLYDTFVASYGAEYGGADASTFSFTAHSYDAAWMVMYGAAWAEGNGDLALGEDYARGLRQLSEGAALEVRATSWNSIKASFAAGTSVDLRGTSGELDYDPVTEETTAPVEVWTIDPTGTEIVVEYVTDP